ncbi:hypothetical protein ACEPAI_1304 [Sanghuangporus weigelae]
MALELSSNAASRLEPFLLMSKSAKGAAAAKLCQDATSAPGVFVFGELLEMPNIQELSKNEQAPHFRLLELFAYGSLDDYNNSRDILPPLNQSQLTKLRLLTIISLALDHRILPYALLLRSLQIPTIRELEDLIIDAIYLDLMRGKLDQKEQQFEVEYVIGRDLGPGQVQILLTSLQAWAQTTSSVLTTLDSQLAQLASQELSNKLAREEQERVVQATLAEVKKENRSLRPGRGGDRERDDADMDIDEPRGGSGTVNQGGLTTSLSNVLDAGKGRKFKMTDLGKQGARKRNRF